MSMTLSNVVIYGAIDNIRNDMVNGTLTASNNSMKYLYEKAKSLSLNEDYLVKSRNFLSDTFHYLINEIRACDTASQFSKTYKNIYYTLVVVTMRLMNELGLINNNDNNIIDNTIGPSPGSSRIVFASIAAFNQPSPTGAFAPLETVFIELDNFHLAICRKNKTEANRIRDTLQTTTANAVKTVIDSLSAKDILVDEINIGGMGLQGDNLNNGMDNPYTGAKELVYGLFLSYFSGVGVLTALAKLSSL